MSEYILVKYSDNYADEFNIEGFWVGTPNEWEDIKDVMKKQNFPVEIYFGTNECMEYSNYQNWERQFTISKITDEEYKFLVKTFNINPKYFTSYGMFIYNEDLPDE